MLEQSFHTKFEPFRVCSFECTKNQTCFQSTVCIRIILFDYRRYKCHTDIAHADVNPVKFNFRSHIHKLTHNTSVLLFLLCIVFIFSISFSVDCFLSTRFFLAVLYHIAYLVLETISVRPHS